VTVCGPTGTVSVNADAIWTAFGIYSSSPWTKFLAQYGVTVFNLKADPRWVWPCSRSLAMSQRQDRLELVVLATRTPRHAGIRPAGAEGRLRLDQQQQLSVLLTRFHFAASVVLDGIGIRLEALGAVQASGAFYCDEHGSPSARSREPNASRGWRRSVRVPDPVFVGSLAWQKARKTEHVRRSIGCSPRPVAPAMVISGSGWARSPARRPDVGGVPVTDFRLASPRRPSGLYSQFVGRRFDPYTAYQQFQALSLGSRWGYLLCRGPGIAP